MKPEAPLPDRRSIDMRPADPRDRAIAVAYCARHGLPMPAWVNIDECPLAEELPDQAEGGRAAA